MHITDKNSVLEPRAAMMARLLQIHDDARGEGTDEGAMIVTFEGYISGIPEFFTNDETEPFRFTDRKQAGDFITEFADPLHNPQVLDYP
jgi:hypothetical protein